jgi:hypothetical protein
MPNGVPLSDVPVLQPWQPSAIPEVSAEEADAMENLASELMVETPTLTSVEGPSPKVLALDGGVNALNHINLGAALKPEFRKVHRSLPSDARSTAKKLAKKLGPDGNPISPPQRDNLDDLDFDLDDPAKKKKSGGSNRNKRRRKAAAEKASVAAAAAEKAAAEKAAAAAEKAKAKQAKQAESNSAAQPEPSPAATPSPAAVPSATPSASSPVSPSASSPAPESPAQQDASSNNAGFSSVQRKNKKKTKKPSEAAGTGAGSSANVAPAPAKPTPAVTAAAPTTAAKRKGNKPTPSIVVRLPSEEAPEASQNRRTISSNTDNSEVESPHVPKTDSFNKYSMQKLSG